ncbi:NurA domain-containing protein [Chromobacterium violaceum]|uniref:DNA double-strand break repair nuclease NurA n=1 Tax=Chromobacterium violaceum TaxID=536 RepID=UPI003CF33808
MTYASNGPKPYEKASKSSHHHVINDPLVTKELSTLHIPPKVEGNTLNNIIIPFRPQKTTISDVVAIDGGYSEIPIREGYPSATIHFFQFGALHFEIEDLEKIEGMMHISPEDMQRLRNIDRLKFALATRGARRANTSSLNESVRYSLFDFLGHETLGEEQSLLSTLAWFIFRRYKSNRSQQDTKWILGSNPYKIPGGIELIETEMSQDYKFCCPQTGKDILLSDVFRLHELIEEEVGAAGVAGYISGLVEHLIVLHLIRYLLKKNSAALNQVLFIMDRPTGWFGVTAPMHKLMIELNQWLFNKHNLFFAGLEKSGAFVEHASQIRDKIPPGSIVILNDEYIYKYISPGEEDPNRPYASTSYYGTKVFFKTLRSKMYVISLPVPQRSKCPQESDIPNLHSILTHVEQLHCDMYENALLPVALANKLVSLSAHPSSQILKAFAKSNFRF